VLNGVVEISRDECFFHYRDATGLEAFLFEEAEARGLCRFLPAGCP
jgi:hypothetical protein